MSSYFSSLLTTTTNLTSKVKSLIPSENDGDTEDDTHLCRVLRSYYTEKGRNFPSWLPPDPKAPPPPVVIQPVYSQNVGSRYGGLQSQGQEGGGGRGNGALSSLWDAQPQQQQQQQQDGGLRQGRGQMGRISGQGGAAPQRQNPFLRQQQNATLQSQVEARPLPSQRAGSYQTAQSTPPGSSAGMSAKDRLKRGFQGGRASPAPSATSSTSGGGGGYEDRYAGSGGGGAYDSGRGGDRPFVAATAPWANNETEFGGSGYDGGAYDSGSSWSQGRQGLPSGPRAGRGPGLPSGPRGPR